MGLSGIFFDRAGLDFLASRFKEGAERHLRDAIPCAKKLGLKVALNSWRPEDVLPNPEVDAVLIESAVYGNGRPLSYYSQGVLQKLGGPY